MYKSSTVAMDTGSKIIQSNIAADIHKKSVGDLTFMDI